MLCKDDYAKPHDKEERKIFSVENMSRAIWSVLSSVGQHKIINKTIILTLDTIEGLQ